MSNRIRKIIFIFYLFFSFFVVRRYIQKYLTKRSYKIYTKKYIHLFAVREFSSIGRARALHARGRGIETPNFHIFFQQKKKFIFLKQGIIIYFTTQITQLVYSTLIRKLILVFVRSLINSRRRCKR